jgi:hypothetical protein
MDMDMDIEIGQGSEHFQRKKSFRIGHRITAIFEEDTCSPTKIIGFKRPVLDIRCRPHNCQFRVGAH